MIKRTANLTHVSRRRSQNALVGNASNLVDSLERGLDAIESRLDRESAKELSDLHTAPVSDPLNWGRYAASRMHDFGQR